MFVSRLNSVREINAMRSLNDLVYCYVRKIPIVLLSTFFKNFKVVNLKMRPLFVQKNL